MFDVVWDVLVNLIAVFVVFVVDCSVSTFTRESCGGYGGVVSRYVGSGAVLLYTDCDDELHTARALANHLEDELRDLGCPVNSGSSRTGQT